MRIDNAVRCPDFPCIDIKRELYLVPDIELDPAKVKLVMISEASPPNPADYYYSPGNPLFQQTTLQAFQDAGSDASSFGDILNLGCYFTTAVKCGKTGYGITRETINSCSFLLEKELDLFPAVKVYLLMGDVAIKAVNLIAKRNRQPAVIPAGATYKIRGGEYYFREARAFPSYLQAGPSFFIEKSKRKMIAEDIQTALKLID